MSPLKCWICICGNLRGNHRLWHRCGRHWSYRVYGYCLIYLGRYNSYKQTECIPGLTPRKEKGEVKESTPPPFFILSFSPFSSLEPILGTNMKDSAKCVHKQGGGGTRQQLPLYYNKLNVWPLDWFKKLKSLSDFYAGYCTCNLKVINSSSCSSWGFIAFFMFPKIKITGRNHTRTSLHFISRVDYTIGSWL